MSTTPTPSGSGGAKRGRKPKNGSGSASNSPSPRVTFQTPPQYQQIHWAAGSPTTADSTFLQATSSKPQKDPSPPTPSPGPSTFQTTFQSTASSLPSSIDASTLLKFSQAAQAAGSYTGRIGFDTNTNEDGDGGDDELLPAMADDDYSAQLSWQSQSKDNLKVLMDNFSNDQYDRFEAYRRHALPKQGVRKVIQQCVGQQVSQPVAQIVAGFSKVFVGEIVEKARAVQARRGEHGPLSPDHLREAYRMYQDESGRVGAARPIRSKKLFVR